MCVCVCGGSTIGYPESVCVVVSLKTSDRCGILVGSGLAIYVFTLRESHDHHMGTTAVLYISGYNYVESYAFAL